MVSSFSGSKPQPNLDKYKLKGKGKEVTSTCFLAEVNNKKVVPGDFIYDGIAIDFFTTNCYLQFDQEGKLIAEGSIDKYQSAYPTYHYDYFPNGLLKEMYRIDYDGNRKVLSKYGYHDFGKIKSLTKYDDFGNKIEVSQYIYDNDQQQQKLVTALANGDTTTINLVFENNLLAEMKFEEGGVSYTYDIQGNLIEERWNLPESNEVTVESYAYNENGLCSQSTTRHLNSEDTPISPSEHISYTYDKHKNITSLEYNEGNIKSLISFEYKYDNVGNWTELIEYWEGEPKFILTQKLVYW